MGDIKVVVVASVRTVGIFRFFRAVILLCRGALEDMWRHAYPSESAKLSDPAVSKQPSKNLHVRHFVVFAGNQYRVRPWS